MPWSRWPSASSISPSRRSVSPSSGWRGAELRAGAVRATSSSAVSASSIASRARAASRAWSNSAAGEHARLSCCRRAIADRALQRRVSAVVDVAAFPAPTMRERRCHAARPTSAWSGPSRATSQAWASRSSASASRDSGPGRRSSAASCRRAVPASTGCCAPCSSSATATARRWPSRSAASHVAQSRCSDATRAADLDRQRHGARRPSARSCAQRRAHSPAAPRRSVAGVAVQAGQVDQVLDRCRPRPAAASRRSASERSNSSRAPCALAVGAAAAAELGIELG